MELRSYYRMVSFGVSVPFGAFNGIEPYTFSVEANGAGGTITSQGIYTAPQKEGVDTIKVADSNGEQATYKINVGGPLKIVADIIAKYMSLSQDQIYLYNSKIPAIKDARVYISITPLTSRVFSSSRIPGGDTEKVCANVFMPLDIQIFSRTTEALLRKEEVVLALNTSYAERQQELNSIFIGQISGSIVPISQEEGAAIPYAFNISANIQYVARKQSSIDYFDSFTSDEVIINP